MNLDANGLDPRVAQIARLFEHLAWADVELGRAVTRPDAPADAIREYAHVVGTAEVWLSRIQHRAAAVEVWPALAAAEVLDLAPRVAAAFKQMISTLNDSTLDAPVKYTNTRGQTFVTSLGDILLHVAMHGQYHRGKVNQMLRASGAEP